VRFEAAQPNECWQSDFTHYRLTRPDGSPGADTEILTWLDDCSRYALRVSAHARVSGPIVLTQFRAAVKEHGAPVSTLTDNGMVYTARFCGGKGGRNGFEKELDKLHITQKNGHPNHPQTQGKVERFQQTLKKWLAACSPQPATINQLQTLIDAFVDEYNNHRPHRSLPNRQTPAARYESVPRAFPPGQAPTKPHNRVRHDKIDKTGRVTLRHAGKLYHIGVGRTHAQTPINILVQDLNITIINKNTGEVLRQLTLDTTRNYQPTGKPKNP
jgi:hypothetical protein